MKKLFGAAVLVLSLALALLASVPATVQIFQTTIGASTTQIVTGNTYCRQIFLQNNSTHVMRVGDSTTTSSKGVSLAAGPSGGSITVTNPVLGATTLDLSDWFVNGTQNDVIDATCTK